MVTVKIDIQVDSGEKLLGTYKIAKLDDLCESRFVIDHFGILKMSSPSFAEAIAYSPCACVRGALYRKTDAFEPLAFSGALYVIDENGDLYTYRVIPVTRGMKDIQDSISKLLDECINETKKAMDIRREYEMQKAHDEQMHSYTFSDYMKDAMRTKCPDFSKNDQYGDGGLGISGEAGEVSDMIKKYLYQGHKLDHTHLLEELGDVLWYIAEIADAAGFSLEDVARWNIEKLKERYPDGFTREASVNRKV